MFVCFSKRVEQTKTTDYEIRSQEVGMLTGCGI